MGTEIKITAKGIEDIEKKFQAMIDRGVNTLPLMRELGKEMIRIVHGNFEAEGRPVKWKERSPLSKKNLITQEQNRKKLTKRYQSLKVKGRATLMRKAEEVANKTKILSSKISSLKNSIIDDPHKNYVAVGPSGGLPYARIHQLGGVIRPKRAKWLLVPCGNGILRLKKVTIPARPYLIVPDSEISKLAECTTEHFEKAVRNGK